MEGSLNYDSLLILSFLAFVTPIIINSIKKISIPFVVGEILVGMIVGKSFLNLIADDIWIHFLSHLGLAYLMFLSGLEIDIESFKPAKRKKGSSILLCLFMFIVSLGISYLITKYYLSRLGLIKNITFFTLLFCATAPGLLVPFLKQRKLLGTELGQTLLIFSLIGEFVCLISLTLVSSTIAHGMSYKNFLFILVFLASFGIYFAIKWAMPKMRFSMEALDSQQIWVRAAFALVLVLVTLSEKIGSEIILGSFLAGVIFTLIAGKNKEELQHKLDIIGYGFLIPIFFIMVGVNLDILSIFKNPRSFFYIPLFLIVVFIVKFIPSLLLIKRFGINKAFSSSVLLSSQLSLMIVGAQMAYDVNLIDTSAYSAIIFTTIISCLAFPLIFDRTYKYSKKDLEGTYNIKDRILIREALVSNQSIIGKALKEIEFPDCCRVFLVVRDNYEILPTGDTVIHEGDRVVLVGFSCKMEEVIDTIEKRLE